MFSTTISVLQLITLVSGTLLPILVNVVTKYETNEGIRAVMLAALSAATGFFGQWGTHPDGFDWQQAALASITVFIIAVAADFGLWQKTGVAEKAKRVGTRTTTTTLR